MMNHSYKMIVLTKVYQLPNAVNTFVATHKKVVCDCRAHLPVALPSAISLIPVLANPVERKNKHILHLVERSIYSV